jgi:hypothetical protein
LTVFCNNTLISLFSIISINKVLPELITETVVEVSNPVVDFKPVEYVKVFIPKVIKDGTKHVIYTSMIHALVYLNPNIEKEYIFSYLYYVNSRYARPKMEKREFIRLFNLVYNGIKATGEVYVNKEMKYIHFNPGCNVSIEEKINISNMINGCKRRNESIQKIINAKNELEKLGKKITKKRLADISGLSIKTIRAHFNSPLIDMDEVLEMVNDSVPINGISNTLT